jgi:hypothetical protein
MLKQHPLYKIQTASFVQNAQTASYVENAQTASFVTSASYAQTASYVENALTASFVTGSIFTSTNPALSASYAQTASYALNSPDIFPYTGSAIITGSLEVIGDTNITGSINLQNSSTNRINFNNAAAINQPQIRLKDYATGITMRGNDVLALVSNGSGMIGMKKTAATSINFPSAAKVGFTNNTSVESYNPETYFHRYSSGVIGIGYGAVTSANVSGSLILTNITIYNEGIVLGNVGIGTAVPTAKLHVVGNTFINGSISSSGVISSSLNDANHVLGGTLSLMGTANGSIHLYSLGALRTSLNSKENVNSYINAGGRNLGIGTTSPNAKLDISGSVNISGSGVQVPLQVSSGSTSLLFVSGSGNVGIGTATPTAKLHVVGNTFINGSISSSGVISSSLNDANHVLGGTLSLMGTANGSIHLYSVGALRTSLNARGNVNSYINAEVPTNLGIGTITPTAKLHVAGSTLISGSLTVTGSVIATTGFTGSLQGTASFATSASYAQTASYVENAQTASFVTGSIFTSANPALSASYAQTASFVQNAQTASFVLNAISSSFASTASFVENAQTASFVTLAQTASYVEIAQTASYIVTAQTASFVTTAQTASYVENAQTASFVNTLNQSVTITGAITASSNISASGYLVAQNITASNNISASGTIFGTFQQITGITVLQSDWTLDSGLYESDISNANITSNTVVDVIPDNADYAIVLAAQLLPANVSSAGAVKIFAVNEPTDDINVTLNLFK